MHMHLHQPKEAVSPGKHHRSSVPSESPTEALLNASVIRANVTTTDRDIVVSAIESDGVGPLRWTEPEALENVRDLVEAILSLAEVAIANRANLRLNTSL